MNRNRVNRLFAAIALLALLTAGTSCNRGMGCPNNFEVSAQIVLEKAPCVVALLP